VKFDKSVPEWIRNIKVGDTAIDCTCKLKVISSIELDQRHVMPDWARSLIPDFPDFLDGFVIVEKVWDFWYNVVNSFFQKNGLFENPVIVDVLVRFEDGSFCGLLSCGMEATPENIECANKHSEWWETEGKLQFENSIES
jgi:hypothetical protein